MGSALLEADITADGFSSKVYLNDYFNFSLTGTWTGTVWVQRSFNDGNTWEDVESFTGNTAQRGREIEYPVAYRFGCKAGGYGSGTIHGRFGK